MNRVKKFTSIITLFGLISGALSTTATVTLASSLAKQNQKDQAKVVEENNLKIQLQNCERKSAQVTCSFLITNLGADAEVGIVPIYNSSFDYSGNQYEGKLAQIANEKPTESHSIGATRLLNGITTKASVRHYVKIT
jgi:hypothetical protein